MTRAQGVIEISEVVSGREVQLLSHRLLAASTAVIRFAADYQTRDVLFRSSVTATCSLDALTGVRSTEALAICEPGRVVAPNGFENPSSVRENVK